LNSGPPKCHPYFAYRSSSGPWASGSVEPYFLKIKKLKEITGSVSVKWGPPFQNATPSNANERENRSEREAARQAPPVSSVLLQLLLLLSAAAAAA
jgi:hypothetical protein